MELIENLFRLRWQLFLSLSTFSKIFIIVVFVLILIGALDKAILRNKLDEELKKELKMKEKARGKGEIEEENIDDYLLKL